MLKKSSSRTLWFSKEWWVVVVTSMFLFSLLASPSLYKVEWWVQTQSLIQPAYANFAPWNQSGQGIALEQLLWEVSTPRITYIVKRWETLQSIAQEYGTTVRALARVNALQPDAVLLQGQNIIIAYDEWVVHIVDTVRTVKDFARKYNLNVDDIVSLNYIDSPDYILEIGQELFLDMHRIEAETRWLVAKREFEEVFVPHEELSMWRDLQENDVYIAGDQGVDSDKWDDRWEIKNTEVPDREVIYQKPVDQIVITAEQTQRQQEEIKKARETMRLEEDRRMQEEKDREKQEKLEKQSAQNISPKTQETQRAQNTQKTQQSSCGEWMCSFNWKCLNKPEQAVCLAWDPNYAWACKEWYRESWGGCVDQATFNRIQEEAKRAKENADNEARQRAAAQASQEAETRPSQPQKKVEVGVVSSKHLNPRNEWFGGQWFAWWHCTYYAAYRWWKDWNSVTWRWNANQWLKNAAASWVPTWQSPKIGSIVVFAWWPNGWAWYGHVAYVTAVDSGRILIEEMNYSWRWVHTTRWVATEWAWILGYIYQ
jgi:surface antigen/LysM repeat protein